MHKSHLERYTSLTANKRKRLSDNAACSSPAPKQLRLDQCGQRASVSQQTVDRLVMDVVIEGLLPFSFVSLPSVKALVTGLRPDKTVMCRDTAKSRMKSSVADMKRELCAAMQSVACVATTTDCWSARGKAFIGVTSHWISPDSLERVSAALACRRITGSHTFDVLANVLDDIHTSYGIATKVCKTTTDNGSNFVKAFSVFGQAREVDSDTDSDDDENNEDVAFQAVGDLDASGLEYQLPSHQRCACHTLQLIATGDADQAESDGPYKKLSRAAFAKCQALWNKSSKSVLAAEAVVNHCGMALIRPNQTRWNSIFMAVDRLVRISTEKGEDALHLLFNELRLPR